MRNFSMEYKNRQIIPRWLPYYRSQMVNNREKFKVMESSDIEVENYRKLINDWEQNKSISFAIQLLATSDILGFKDTKEYTDVVSYIKNKKGEVDNNILLKDFFDEDELNSTDQKDFKEQSIIKSVKEIKLKILDNYRDAILWVDLAYFHCMLGNIKKAEKYIRIALNMNNYNSYIVRSAARFYIFNNDPEQALKVLRKSPNLLINPMILSSEIAISEAFDFKSRFVKKGQSLLYDSNFSQGKLSELNATIGTLEYNNGNIKNSKRYLNSALSNPNENTLAQIQFLYEKRNIDFSAFEYDVPFKFEADTWAYYYNHRYRDTVIESERWHIFQPISSKPVILNSFIRGAFFDEHKEAVEIIDEVLKLKPNDIDLLNNKAFSLAKLNNISEAMECLNKIEKIGNYDLSKTDNITSKLVVKATLGLIQYCSKNDDIGRKSDRWF